MNRRWIAPLLALLAILVGGTVVVALAYGAGAASAGASATAVPHWAYAGPYGWGFGWGFGFLFPLVSIVLVLLLVRGIFWGYRGPRAWGRDPDAYRPAAWQHRREASFEEWHRRAHGGQSDGDPDQGPDDATRPRP